MVQKIYKSKPKGRGWEASDPAKNAKSARTVANGYKGSCATRIVKTGKKGDVYPYTIYTNC